MTIQQAIDAVDSVHHNTFTDHDKIAWLAALDAMVKTEILDNYKGEDTAFAGYDDQTDRAAALLVKAPFDEMYLYHLEAKIHYYNGEYDRYNNAAAMFRTVYDSFRQHYNRTHDPKTEAIRYF